ncbi:MAG: histidine kinase, partial [Anaerolineae bacterium]
MLSSYRVRQRDYLLKISQALTAQLDLDTVLQMVMKAAARLMSGQAGLIALRQSGGGFAIHAMYGLPASLKGYFSTLLSDIP